jgi:DNA polymerase phi
VLQCFWDLAELDVSKRVAASRLLVDHLRRESQDAEAAQANGGFANDSHDGIDRVLHNFKPLTRYVIKRLCRGLASGRMAARQGFALALAAIIGAVNGFDEEVMLGLIVSTREDLGDSKDDLLGHMFGLAALLRSGAVLPVAVLSSILEQALDLASKKSFLREAAAAVAAEITRQDDLRVIAVLKDVNQCQVLLSTAPATPEALVLALHFWRFMPQKLRTDCAMLPAVDGVTPSSDLFTRGRAVENQDDGAIAAAFFTKDHLRALVPVLNSSVHAHPRLHTIWSMLLTLLLPGYSPSDPGSVNLNKRIPVQSEQLQAFWEVLIEGDIFSSSSHDRKHLGCMIFLQLVRHMKADDLVLILTPNFLRVLSNNITRKDRYLHSIAQQCTSEIIQAVNTSKPDTQASIIVAIGQHGGSALTSVLDKAHIPSAAGGDEEADFIEMMLREYEGNVNLHEEDELENYANRQQLIVGKLASVAKQGSEAARKKVLLFLLEKGVFREDESISAADITGTESYGALRTQIVGHLLSVLEAAAKTKTAGRQQEDDAAWAAAQAHAMAKSGRTLAVHMSTESQQTAQILAVVRENISQLLSALDQDEHNKFRQLVSLQCLASLMELYALANPVTADPSIAADLQHVIDDHYGNHAKQDEGVHWADALVDVILAVMSRNESPLPSAPVRDAAQRTFRVFASEVTSTGVEDLLAVVTQPLDQRDRDEEISGSDVDEEGEAQSGEGAVHTDGSDSELADTDTTDDEDADPGENADTLSEAIDNEGGFTDEQMFKLDAQLSAVFSTMRSRRDNKSVRQDIINFKLRTLACIEAYMKKVPSSSLLLIMPTPLLAALNAAVGANGDQVLAQRLAGLLIHHLSRCKAEAAGNNCVAEELEAQLRRTLYLASRGTGNSVLEAAKAAYIFLLRAAFASVISSVRSTGEESLIVALQDFFEKKKTRLHRKLFVDIFRRIPAAAAMALPTLSSLAIASRTEFLRQEGYALVEQAVKDAARTAVIPSLKGEAASNFAGLILAALQTGFTKPQRKAEILKRVASILQALQPRGSCLADLIGDTLAKEVLAAVRSSLETNASDSQLRRLDVLLSASDKGGERKRKLAGKGKKNQSGGDRGKEDPPRRKRRS